MRAVLADLAFVASLARPALGALSVALLATLVSPVGAQTLTPPDSTVGCQWLPECSAPGATLRMVELSRSGSGRDTRLGVSPRISGLPSGVPLTFWMRRLGQEPQWIATGYELDAAGAVACADRARHAALATEAGTGWCPVPLDSISLGIGGAMQGERFAFAFSTLDGAHSAYAVVVPRPVTASVAGCGTLDAHVVDAEAKVVSITGQGFAPAAQVATESRSGKETVPGQVTTDSAGRFVAVVMPATRGGRGGEAAFTARAAGCEVTLAYPWGRAAR